MLRYFKSEADDVPKGQLCLPEHGGRPAASVTELPDYQFVVKTDELPDGLVVRGEDALDAAAWVAAIRAASGIDVGAMERNQLRKKTIMQRQGFQVD